MKISAFALAAGVGLALAGATAGPFAAPANAQATKDTGNMAYPAPLPQGQVSTTVTQPRTAADTGNMAYPAPQPAGTVGGAAATPGKDTGSMAYPAPKPAGNLATTPTKQ